MFEHTIVTFIMISGLLAGDSRRFKQMGRKEWISYGLMLAACVYLTLLFILQPSWPNYSDLLRVIYGWPADQIVAFLKSYG